MTGAQIKEMSERVHTANAKWWVDLETGEPLHRSVGELLMLTVSELAEALEGHRKGLMDDKLPDRPMVEVELADTMIRVLDIIGGMKLRTGDMEPVGVTWPDNMAECLMLLTSTCVYGAIAFSEEAHNVANREYKPFDWQMSRLVVEIVSLAKAKNLDLMGAYEAKMAYNAVRADHQHEARKAAGGKKY